LYDVLFACDSRSLLIANVFLETWPEIFRRPTSEGSLDPLAETFIWIIYNTGVQTSKAELKV
jgi:hypothetical protein